jgi:serine/threonine protein kinase
MDAHKFDETINPSTFNVVGSYPIEARHYAVITRSKQDPNYGVALRLRAGRAGFSAFRNELSVYLLPSFRHENMLPFLGCEKRLRTTDEDVFTSLNTLKPKRREEPYHSEPSLGSSATDDGDDESEQGDEPPVFKPPRRRRPWPKLRSTIEYWIANESSNCITLRQYLTINYLDWTQMVQVAKGIASGEEAFAKATDGHFKLVHFKAPTKGRMRLAPLTNITIVHRNLSSINILLRKDLTPCIWNFGTSRVFQPMQPVNYLDELDRPIYDLHESSVYTAPEVLSKTSHFTLTAMKAIDNYALGLVLWELISRCRLPPIPRALNSINLERLNPFPYCEPFHRELACEEPTFNLLYKNICGRALRPHLRACWLSGKKSARFCRLICDLWDPDYEARLQVGTVCERLSVLSKNKAEDRLVRNEWSPRNRRPKQVQELSQIAVVARPFFGRTGLEKFEIGGDLRTRGTYIGPRSEEREHVMRMAGFFPDPISKRIHRRRLTDDMGEGPSRERHPSQETRSSTDSGESFLEP